MESPCVLTAKDYFILETILDRAAPDAPLVPLLRRKLDRATVVLRDDVPSDVVTINSRIAYRVDGGAPVSRLLVQGEGRDFPDFALSIHTPRGLALLGVAEGRSVLVEAGGGRAERLVVEKLLYQPEAAMRGRESGGEAPRRIPAMG